MRPETFYYKMNQAFDHWVETKSVSYFLPLLREMDRVWKNGRKKKMIIRPVKTPTGIKTKKVSTIICSILQIVGDVHGG